MTSVIPHHPDYVLAVVWPEAKLMDCLGETLADIGRQVIELLLGLAAIRDSVHSQSSPFA